MFDLLHVMKAGGIAFSNEAIEERTSFFRDELDVTQCVSIASITVRRTVVVVKCEWKDRPFSQRMNCKTFHYPIPVEPEEWEEGGDAA